jgi:hypothetical protein
VVDAGARLLIASVSYPEISQYHQCDDPWRVYLFLSISSKFPGREATLLPLLFSLSKSITGCNVAGGVISRQIRSEFQDCPTAYIKPDAKLSGPLGIRQGIGVGSIAGHVNSFLFLLTGDEIRRVG